MRAWRIAPTFPLVLVLACGHAAPPPSGVAPVTASSDAGADPSPPAASVDAAPVTAPPAAVDAGAAQDASLAPGAILPEPFPGYSAGALKEAFEKNAAKLLACFVPAHKKDPKLRGHVNVRFEIGSNGRVKTAEDHESNLPDARVVQCVVKAVKTLQFPKPESGNVTIVYPFIFHSYDPLLILPDSASPAPASK